jgi:hypothetical protein
LLPRYEPHALAGNDSLIDQAGTANEL